MAILKKYDLNPDGVRIVVNWDDMVIGSSVFILSINVQEALSQIKNVMNDKGWEYQMQIRVEDEKLGVRVWRLT
jgi:phenylacetate-coenzyme A ligase PaaK-like adenylate-forming protein|tara:strand:+ start:313 stop:534 length:222 start_codon:yes stop_codon:yes gene_type:complete